MLDRSGDQCSIKRKCQDCSLCCKLLAVPQINKKSGERCAHQRHTGCMIYHKPEMPSACRLWSCRWLADPEKTVGLSRPDRSHYVIDVIPDIVQWRDDQTDELHTIDVIQIWVDPKHRNAHRDPALRAYLLEQAETGVAALIRYSSGDGFVLFAPPMAADGEWHEQCGQMVKSDLSPMQRFASGKI